MESIRYMPFWILAAAVCMFRSSQASDTKPTETYDLQKYCNGSQPELTIQKAAFLKLDKGKLTKTSCMVNVRSMWDTGDGRLRMQILPDELNLPCSMPGNLHSSLRIFTQTGNGSTIMSYPEKICSNGSRFYQAMYLNPGNNMMLELQVNKDLLPEVSLRFLFTAAGYTHEEDNDDFVCDNNLRVSADLTCDDNNNCGDRSDESERVCDRLTTKLTVVSIFLGIFGVTSIVLLVLLLIWKRKATDAVTPPKREPVDIVDENTSLLKPDRRPSVTEADGEAGPLVVINN